MRVRVVYQQDNQGPYDDYKETTVDMTDDQYRHFMWMASHPVEARDKIVPATGLRLHQLRMSHVVG